MWSIAVLGLWLSCLLPRTTAIGSCRSSQFSCKSGECIPLAWKCDEGKDCKDGSDEANCGTKKCKPTEWKCNTGVCIKLSWKCDGDNDCTDGSDETNCTTANCKSSMWKCNSGECINLSWKCDGENDCKDGSDETNCTTAKCRSTEWECNSGECVNLSWKCDGDKDCKDGSDEKDCGINNCRSFQWRCKSGNCIKSSWKCDGDRDCADGSDEENCSTKKCKSSEWQCKSEDCIPLRWKCDGDRDCQDESDEKGCEIPTCRPSEFMCGDGTCILSAWRCDTNPDCSDKSDEKNCTHIGCKSDEFTCSSKRCISSKWVCDGETDCDDDSDEIDCPRKSKCKSDEFMCNNSICIPSKRRCNGIIDCSDSSDEASCEPKEENELKCPSGKWACANDTCILPSMKCDGKMDCTDGSDEENCDKDGNHTLIYCARSDLRMASTNGSVYLLKTPRMKLAVSVDIDYSQKQIYWTDIVDDVLYRAPVDGDMSDTEVILRNYEEIGGIAIDWIGRKLYWTDGKYKSLRVAELNGSNKGNLTYLGPGSKPRAIVCHPNEGYLYWSDWGETAAIERMSMDGDKATREKIIALAIIWPNGLTLDLEQDKLYWADAKLKKLEVANLDGTGRRILARNNIGFPYALTNIGRWLYWSDWGEDRIMGTTKSHAFINVKTIRRVPIRVMGIKVYDTSVQPEGINPCAANNGACSHLCLIAAKETGRLFSCKCPMGMHLKGDGKTCGTGREIDNEIV